MKKQKQLRLSTFMINTEGVKDGNDTVPKEEKGSKHLISRKRTRSQGAYKNTTVASIFQRPKAKAKQSDLLAENLGKLLSCKPQYLTSGNNDNGDPVSWILHIRNWFPSTATIHTSIGSNVPNTEVTSASKPVQDFDSEWKLHPTMRKQLKVFGRQVSEKRWSQAWGKPISYSGMIDHHDRPLDESPNLPWLIDQVNSVMKNATGVSNSLVGQIDDEATKSQREDAVQHSSGSLVFHEYNACLQNWYRPEDSIGLHSDDESYLYQNYPIFSVSWGGTRRFLLRPKTKPQQRQQGTKKRATVAPAEDPIEVWLKDGDLLIMGGACQTTHKHEVPKPRKKDPATSNRISWTIRAIKE